MSVAGSMDVQGVTEAQGPMAGAWSVEPLSSWHGTRLSGLLKQAGVRVTHPRLLVLGCLWESPGQALSANGLYQLLLARRQPMSLSTIYSVLQTFKQQRLVSVQYLDEGVQGFTCVLG